MRTWDCEAIQVRPVLGRGFSFPALALLLMSAHANAAPAVAVNRALIVDSVDSKVHFDIGVLVVLRRSGTFSAIEGQVDVDASGKLAHILIRIPTKSARMKDPDQTALLLSPDFFDARSHPWIVFRSDALPLEAAKAKRVRGSLAIRGVERPVVFQVQADACLDDPGLRRCHVRVEGSVRRSSFGMVEYKRTLADQVRLRIDVVLRPAEKSKSVAAAKPVKAAKRARKTP